MDKSLLDTDILSEILKGRDSQVAVHAAAYRRAFGRYTISAINVMEVVKGLQKAGRLDRTRQFLASVESEEVLPFDADAAIIAGRIYAELESAGLTIGRADPMIAGITISRGLVLATGNIAHFERIRQAGYPLRIENWR